MISIGFGAYYGLVMQSYKFNGQAGLQAINGNLGLAIKRICVFAGLMIPGGLPYLLNLIPEIQSQVILLVFGQILPIFLITFVPFTWSDEVCKKYGLLSTGNDPQIELYSKLINEDP